MASRTSAEQTTDITSTTFTFNWTIQNFNYYKRNLLLHSDPFKTDDVCWQAVFECVAGKMKVGWKFLGCPVLGPCFQMSVVYCFRSNEMKQYLSNAIIQAFDSKSYEHYEDIPQHLSTHALKLTLTFYVTKRKLGNFIIPPSTVLQDLDPDVKNREFTTVDLKIGKTPITMKAHKEVLAARSPVFAAMFNTNMRESQQNSITISDIDEQVFKKLLKYIYTDKVDISENMLPALLAAADKYDLARLKAACESAIFRSVSVSTAIETLILADKHNAQQLKTHVLQFIGANADDVMKGNGWEAVIEEYPQLLLEMNKAMAMK